MSYSVEYNPELRNLYPYKCKKTRKLPVKALVIMLSILITIYTLNTSGILRYLIPGDPAVTAGAFSDMLEQVQSGQTVSEALLTFVKDVITGGMDA